MISGDLLAVVLALVAGVAWLVRLESRISRAEERHSELLTEYRTLKRAHYRLADTFRETFGGQIKILRLPGAGASDDSDEG